MHAQLTYTQGHPSGAAPTGSVSGTNLTVALRALQMLSLGLLLWLAAAPDAQADPALAQRRQCLSCHQIDRKVVGPAFSDVARKYAGQDVAARLAQKIRQGGGGNWGAVPMPAMKAVSESEALQLAQWVLTLAH